MRGIQVRKRRRMFFLRAGVVLALCIALVGGFAALTRLDAFTISSVHIEGAATVSESDIEHIAATALAGHYLFLFPKANALFYPASLLRASIAEAFPRVQSVGVSLKSPTSLSVSLVERTPHALWCGVKNSADAGQCYFLDETGFVFSKAPDFSGNVFFRYYGGITAEDPVGTALFSPARFKQLDFFINSVRDTGVDPVSFAFLPDDDVEIALKNGSRILFNLEQDLSAVFENFQSVLASDILKDQGVLKLEYLDLRFGNKVFYKFK